MISQYPARKKYIKPNDLIQPYFIAYRDSWHALSRERFHAIDKDDFIFISGQIETYQWAIGVCQQKDSIFTIKGEVNSYIFDHEASNDDCEARSGPRRRYMRYDLGEDSMVNPIQDQSIFLNFYKARPRIFGPPKIVASSEPGSPPDNNDRHKKPNVSGSAFCKDRK